MATTIRLKRVGRKKQSAFRVVVIDSRTGTSGPSIEKLGVYNPRTEPSLLRLDAVRTLHWLREGADPSHSVRSLLRRAGLWEKFHAGVAPEELEEPIIFLGPAEGRQKTSRRPPPEDERAAAAATAPAVEEPEMGEEGTAEAEEIDVAEAEEIDVAEAAEAATAPEAREEPEEAPGGTEAADEVREASVATADAEAEAPADAEAEEEGGEPAEEAAEAEEPKARAEAGPEGDADAEEDEEDEAAEEDEEDLEDEEGA